MNPTPAVAVSPLAPPDVQAREERGTLPPDESRPAAEETRNAVIFHRMCLVVLLILVSASAFSAFYEKWHFREQGARGTYIGVEFDRMIDGTALRPYVYRRFLPDVANWAAGALPVDAMVRRTPQRAKEKIAAALDLRTKAHPAQYVILYIATYLSALLASFALYRVCTAMNIGPPATVFAPVVFMLIFPLIGVKGGYFFDFPELLFMAVAAVMALNLDWWWIIPIAALGTWNKESFLLFIFTLYPFIRRRHSRPHSLLAVCVLAAVCVAVHLPIRMHFALNAGGTVERHLNDQISFFVHPFRLDTWIDRTYDLLFPALSSPIPFLLLVWTAWRGWRFFPPWLKRHAQIAAAINVPLFLLFCEPGEFRDLSLLYISFLLILAFNLEEWMKSAKGQKAELSTEYESAL